MSVSSRLYFLSDIHMNHDLQDHGPFCLHCACNDRLHVRQNGSGETQCENCGFSESE